VFDRPAARIVLVLVEVIGRRQLSGSVDRDDVEDLLTGALGATGEVTGAGVGWGMWHLGIEASVDAGQVERVFQRLVATLVAENLGWVVLQVEGRGRLAEELG